MARLSRSEVEGIRQSLKTEMHRHLPKWRTLAKYIAPHRLKESDQKVDGRRKDENIINNQAGRSLRTFVSGMMNGATPRSRPWFNLISASPKSSKSNDESRYYAETEKVLDRHFQISNLYRVLPMTYKDVGVFSNSAFAMLPHARYGFYFYPFAIGTYAFASDREGRTDMFCRDFTLNVRQVVETYGQLDQAGKIIWDNLPIMIEERYKAAKYMEEIILTQVIVPNSLYNPEKAKMSLDPSDKKFQSYTYILGSNASGTTQQNPTGFRQAQMTDKDEKRSVHEFLKVGGYDYFPVITPRWEVEPEGYYGIDGPGEIALADIQTLQEQEKYRMEGIAKLVRPPMVGHASLRRHASSILAGGITYVDDRGMAQGFKPAFTLNPQLSELIGAKEEIQSYIKTAFYEDLFLQLSSQRTISHVTAAQINQQTAETMAAMAPVLGQWDHDLSSPLIENALFILGEAGKLPKKPESLKNDRLVPEYISVLAQASKASLTASQEKYVQFVAGTAEMLQDPTLLKMANGESLIRAYAENEGIAPQLVLDELQYKQAKEAAMEAQAAQAQQEAAAAQAQTAKTMADTPLGNGSALDQAIG